MSDVSESHGSRTIMWCMPRSVSTALTKCLSFIEDSEVWFEPYCFCYGARLEYRRATNAELPMEYEGNADAFKKAVDNLEAVFQTEFEPDRFAYGSLMRGLQEAKTKHVFVKDIGNTVTKDIVQFLPSGYKHTFLIRNPLRSIYSYRKFMFALQQSAGFLDSKITNSNYDLERDDRYFLPGCFMKEHYDFWVYVKENLDSDPVVIDADDLLTNPKETLSAYCTAVGLPYSDSLLQWDASDDIAKKMRAPGDKMLFDLDVFQRAMRSSEFMPPSEMPPRDQLTPDVIRCSERVMEYYEEMYESRLKVGLFAT